MSEKRQHYSEEFKEQTVMYIQEQTKTLPQIGEELNVPVGTLQQWMRKYRKFENEPLADRETLRQKDKQLQEQERTIEDLKEEIAILKKAMHIFSKERN
ncbi:transposase [Cohnella nanjingensis]|uniref:transposase n=1 Tax=Cohnella nanjingensis TaxID=1387779 RepID=UPI001C889C7D|nr:transposase [Cohnella nanjingensis]